MPPQVVENDKKKIEAVIDELDQKKNQALQVFTGGGCFGTLLNVAREFLSPAVEIEHRPYPFQGCVCVYTMHTRLCPELWRPF